MEVVFTEEELNEKCKEWQKILGLQDWEFKCEIARGHELGSNIGGNISKLLEKKAAIIRVLNPIDYHKETIYPFGDMELTLVHELLHAHFAPFEAADDTPQDIAQEQVIHALSKALVSLRREAHALQKQEASPVDVCEQT